MKQANALPWRHLVLFLRLWFGAHLMYSGLAYVLTGWVPTVMSTAAPGAGTVMVVLAEVGLYQPVKYLELINGVLLMTNFAVPLALVIELPLTIFISYLNLVVEGAGRQLFTGPQELFLNISLMLAYGGYYARFLCLRARPWWLWDGFAGPAPQSQPTLAHATLPARALTASDQRFVWVLIAVLVALVLAGSQFLGPPERRLPPRDYVPLIVAVLGVIVAMVREGRTSATTR